MLTFPNPRVPNWKKLLVIWLVMLASNPARAQVDSPSTGTSNTSRRAVSATSASEGGNLQGGAAQADFQSLIDLIQSTVAYDSWTENGTGEGEITPFAINGVYAHAAERMQVAATAEPALEDLHREPLPIAGSAAPDVRRPSSRRYVSLPRLERTLQRCQQHGTPLPEAMLTLAGLQRIDWVVIHPATHDLLLIGPAGDWQLDRGARLVSRRTRQPVLRLDDLLVLLRRQNLSAAFGCSIVPRQQALAQTQRFLQTTGSRPLEADEKERWLLGLRDSLGSQDVEYFGIAPDSHLALVLLQADYHMKLIGMGLVENVPGVNDYLSTVELLPDGSPPPMSVLRWWFSLRDCQVSCDAERTAYQFPAALVQVLSENELLAARGRRIHTHQSDALNQRFAHSFTTEFEALCAKYPLYRELQNIFALAVVCELMQRENLLTRTGWQPTLLADATRLPLPPLRIPETVQSVVNYRTLRRKHIIAGISGGVWVATSEALQVQPAEQAPTVEPGKLAAPADRWWWD